MSEKGVLRASALLRQMRDELAPQNMRILEHPYLAKAERGDLPIDKLRLFVEQQYHIVSHDLRSLALMLSRCAEDEIPFFGYLVEGDRQGLSDLRLLGQALGIRAGQLREAIPIPKAAAYTHYMAWLALYTTPGEQAFALIVNLPVWGRNCGRLGKAIKRRYAIDATSFFEMFAAPTEALERTAIKIIEKYLPERRSGMKTAGNMIQAYEEMFWDAIDANQPPANGAKTL